MEKMPEERGEEGGNHVCRHAWYMPGTGKSKQPGQLTLGSHPVGTEDLVAVHERESGVSHVQLGGHVIINLSEREIEWGI